MERTRPAANHMPQAVQYTPKASSIEPNVLILVRPSTRNFPFVSSATIRNLNLKRKSPATPRPPSHFQGPLGGTLAAADPAGAPACVIRSIFEATAAYCLELGGRSAAASRQAVSSAR